MNELPQGWAAPRLKDILSIQSGFAFRSSDYQQSGHFLIRIANVQDGRISLDKPQYVILDNRTKQFELSSGDILTSLTGNIGRVARISKDHLPAALNQRVAKLLPEPLIMFDGYLYVYLASFKFREELTAHGQGGAQQNVSPGIIGELEIPLPPVPEQRRIVKKLDALSARTTAARAHLNAIEKLVERYKIAVLGQLFGKSGSDPKPTEHLWAIPTTWAWKKIKDIGEVGLGRQRSPENHQGPFMRPYIRSANITWNGVDLSDVKQMNFDSADFERFELKVGDVLLNEGSGSAKEVGKPAIWRGEIPNCCYQNTVLRVQPRDCTSEFLYWYFLLTALTEGFVADTKGVNIQHIGKTGLAHFPIPLPPLDEQDEIVRRIETAFARIDRLAMEAEKALKLTGRLDQRILAKAFAGELVPQDPNDEPAETLVARIRAERQAQPKLRRARRAKEQA